MVIPFLITLHLRVELPLAGMVGGAEHFFTFLIFLSPLVLLHGAFYTEFWQYLNEKFSLIPDIDGLLAIRETQWSETPPPE